MQGLEALRHGLDRLLGDDALRRGAWAGGAASGCARCTTVSISSSASAGLCSKAGVAR